MRRPACVLRGRPVGCTNALEAALAPHRQLGAGTAVAFTLLNLGMVDLAERNHARARRFVEQALPIARETGECLVEAIALSALGWVAFASATACGRSNRSRPGSG